MKSTVWSVRAPAPPSVTARITRETGLSPVLAAMLWSRGLTDNVDALLKPELLPVELPDLEAAARLVLETIEARGRILVHGDYDADGITGTAVLMLGLRELGGRVKPFIPNRLTDGYGISPERISEHSQTDLFISVDCGISNVAEVARLNAAGVKVIITDHHTPGEQLPDSLTVHPSLASNLVPGQAELTGAGVAWHLLWAVRRLRGMPAPFEHADLATIGTIADVAPLLGDNRALVHEGLRRMPDSRWAGVRAIVAQSRLRAPMSARSVAFVIAPRLNAAGRLGEADLALEMLTTANEGRARELAIYLDARNQERRGIQDAMLQRMLLQVRPDEPAIVVHDEDGHPGVMGIVASHLLEKHYRPVFIIAQGKGSVRSTPGISAVGALRHAAEHLGGYGGHAAAAGFSIDPGSIEAFRASINEFVAAHETPVPTVVLDHVLGDAEASESLVRQLSGLEPLGEGLAEPVFGLTGDVRSARAIGRDQGTLRLKLGSLEGVGWRMGDRAAALTPGKVLDAAVSFEINEFRGKRQLEFRLQQLRDSSPLALHGCVDRGRNASVRRGPPEREGVPQVTGPGIERGHIDYHIVRLPLGPGLDGLAVPMTRLVTQLTQLHFDLDPGAIAEVEERLASLPRLEDARQAFHLLSLGRPLPWDEYRSEMLRGILTELDLLDARGFPRSGQKRDPYQSPTLLASETERYRLGSFQSAYRYYDDHAFSVAVVRLFGEDPA